MAPLSATESRERNLAASGFLSFVREDKMASTIPLENSRPCAYIERATTLIDGGIMDGMDIPAGWEKSAHMIISRRWRRILVIGASDSGKSTYCHFLSLRLAEHDPPVAIVDADIGQKDIGPPASLTLGYTGHGVELGAIAPASFFFVGAVSPVRHLLPMVVGVKQLTDLARAPFTIINTTGLIRGVGRILKGYKIEALEPDVIVAIQRAHETESILRAYRNHDIIRLHCSPKAVLKTPEQRRIARERAFSAYFQRAAEHSFDLRELVFQRTLLFSGKTIKHRDFVHFERTSEGLFAISDRPVANRNNVKLTPAGFESNLLAGVADRNNHCLGLAILHRIDFEGRTIALTTPVQPENAQIIQFGDIYINADGIELDRKRRDGY